MFIYKCLYLRKLHPLGPWGLQMFVPCLLFQAQTAVPKYDDPLLGMNTKDAVSTDPES